MAKSKVYFMNMQAKGGNSLLKKFKSLLIQSGINNIFSEKELVGIKLHFGEQGNLAYIRPEYTRVIVDILKENGIYPFLTDSNTLYTGRRSNAVEHIQLASEHGYNLLSAGAPVIIADGLRGLDYEEIEVGLKHFKTIKVSDGISHADGLIVFSHFKGHCEAAFGGAIKNLGMGGAPRPGKMEQHSMSIPFIEEEKCTGCKICVSHCPEKVISMKDNKKAEIHKEKCIGCGECIAYCQFGAVQHKWDTHDISLIERMTEYAYGMWKMKKDKFFFINALIDITPDCDCFGMNDIPLVEDVGFIISRDPVAIEQASFDLVQKSQKLRSSTHYEKIKDGGSIFDGRTPGVDGNYMMKYAEELGMGRREYEIIKIG